MQQALPPKMEEPFITIPQKKPPGAASHKNHHAAPPAAAEAAFPVPEKEPAGKPHTNVSWERKMVYADFRRSFNSMVNSVISSHNEADFQKVSTFIDTENASESFAAALPTCLLINSQFFY